MAQADTTSTTQPAPSRKRAVLWLSAILVQPLIYNTYLIKGWCYDARGNPDPAAIYNHQLWHAEQAFGAVALLCAILLLLQPASRILWRLSVGLMACALLTNITNHVHLRGGLLSGLKSFASSGGIVEFLETGSSPMGELVGGLERKIILIPESLWALHGTSLVLAVLGTIAAAALLAWFSIKRATWHKLGGWLMR